MKKLLTFVLLTCTLLCLCACEPPSEPLALGEDILSDFTAVDFDGNIVDSSILQGHKVTMLNVWATWCKPCTDEMPALAQLHGEYASDGFQVIGICYDAVDRNYNKVQSAYASALQIVEQTGANYRHILPSKSIKNIIDDIQSVPLTIFVNDEGTQIGMTYSGAKSKSEWKKIIDQMLKFANEM